MREFSPGRTLRLALNLAYQRFEVEGLSAFAPFSADPANLGHNDGDNSFGAGVRIGWLGEISVACTRGLEKQVHGKGSVSPMLGGGEADISPGEDSFGPAWSVRY